MPRVHLIKWVGPPLYRDLSHHSLRTADERAFRFSLFPEFIVASATVHPPPQLSGGRFIDGLGNCGSKRLKQFITAMQGFLGYSLLDAELGI
ncbi:hypothetical protein MIMGU_mgv1a017138mg [Erythranthe guttata]|uniref:Uncharacterized protein n=1 Tax=Erythranthe guttata TaxID=4155 RepID=A0A022PTZ0_ERYGU|nr:hypothetical protein MIMGU_mgv1a017138mg [Erythranthe guttata]